ncbi:hypothetical protein ACLBWT_17630 [Paenibacillus sp. D51F]
MTAFISFTMLLVSGTLAAEGLIPGSRHFPAPASSSSIGKTTASSIRDQFRLPESLYPSGST